MKNSDKSLLERYIPILDWVQSYEPAFLKDDLRAGLTVGVLLIPQGMAYAMLAGLPPVYGLYAAMAPLVIYAIFGTSRQLAIGPVAIVSILVLTGVGTIASPGTDEFITLVILTAFLVGCTQFLMGLFRLGFMMNFISQPVLSGFISGAAIIIVFSQLGTILGINVAGSKYVFDIIIEVAQSINEVNLITFYLGLSCVIFILICKKWIPSSPSELISVIIAIIAVWYFELDNSGVEIVGSVETGIPMPSLPALGSAPFELLIPIAFAIALISYIESFALAKTIVRKHPEYRVDQNQELYGLGLSNLIGAFFHAYPVSGSFSRTAVNDENGAKSTFSLLISAALVCLTLLFFTPFIYYLPQAVLAAIIITAVPRLIEIGEAAFLWRTQKREFILMSVTFICTLIFGILEGIGTGVIISLGVVIYQSSYPNIVMLGRLPDTKQYRDLERHPEGMTQSNTIIVRIDSSLYFANTSYMKKKLQQLEVESGKNLKQVIIDAIGINEVDSTALHALKELADNYEDRGIKLIFAGVKGPVRDIFKRSGLEDIVGPEQFYLNINHAVENLKNETEEKSHLV